jgi:hypothetical protein
LETAANQEISANNNTVIASETGMSVPSIEMTADNHD